MALPPTRRRNRHITTNDPAAIAARLPNELRTFEVYNVNYFHELGAWLESHAPTADVEPYKVAEVVGITIADWYRWRLTRPTILTEPTSSAVVES